MYVYAFIWKEGGEGCRKSMRFKIGLLCEKKVNWDFFGPSFQLQGPSFPRGIIPFGAGCQWLCLPWDTFDLNSFHILVSILDIYFLDDNMSFFVLHVQRE